MNQTSPLPFYTRARQAMADPNLQTALDRATGRMVVARKQAIALIADGETARDHARQIRAHTIANLDRYLDEFVAKARALGVHVHFATDAETATRLVVDIARAHDVRRVVKGKSMVSEEIELNHALEAAGMRVVETDLGEYVIQLDHDVPSHIIAPIIHKTKEQVAETFRRELNASEADVADIPQMTAFARRMLRAEFLAADMGISGVNFAVAESGSLCLVENEGNGRLSTTVPRLHVALMGIERIVPTAADLAVSLRVLARSGTGQALTVYTNVITGPRRADDPDGPSELHVVLVDNGRSNMLRTELEEILYCIRCGACLNVCPVYQEIGGHAYGSVYPGPVGAVYTPGRFRHGPVGRPATGEQPVRGVQGGLPGPHRHPAHAAGVARARRRRWRHPTLGRRRAARVPVRRDPSASLPDRVGRGSPRLALVRATRLRQTPGSARRLDEASPLPADGGRDLHRATTTGAAEHAMTRDLFPRDLRDKLKPAGPVVPHPGAFATAPMPPTVDDTIAQFTQACEAVGGRVSRVATAADAADIVLGYLEAPEWQPTATPGPAPFVSWDASHLVLPDVVGFVHSRGAERLDAFVHPDQATRDTDYRRLDTAVVGVTGAHAALADTGSVVLVHGEGRARLVSLLPPVHVALVPIDRLHATLGELFVAEPALLRTSANVVVVTGPSRTADIEMTLTRGVHGPRIVHVVFVG